VNRFVEKDERPPELLQIGASAEQHQLARLADLKRRRDASAVAGALAALREAAAGAANTMPHILAAVRAYVTVGEICGTMKEVFGSYTEANIL